MKYSILIFTLAAICFVGCSTPAYRTKKLDVASPDFVPRTQEKEKVVLIAIGNPGQSMVADLNIDGKQQTFHINTPGEIHLQTCVTYGTIRKISGSGTLTFEIKPDVENPSRSVGFGTLKGRQDRLQFGYHAGEVEVVR